MKWVADISTALIAGTTKTQKFVCLLTIIILTAGYFGYQEYTETEIELHRIHSHVDTVYTPAPVPDEHHIIMSGKGNSYPSKSQERIASKG